MTATVILVRQPNPTDTDGLPPASAERRQPGLDWQNLPQ